jgi:branched-chain amino acid transport system substrate-binding protein
MTREHPDGLPRREFLARAGGGGLLLASGGLLAACGGVKKSNVSTSDTITLGYVSPRTGAEASFGEPDSYIVGLVRSAVGSGLQIGGKKYKLKIVEKDSQSTPQRAGQVANDLINGQSVDLMLASSTPETVNPVSDACEASGVPCLSTVVPWEAWYFGRGAKPGKPSPFKWTYHFCFGTEDFAKAYVSLWSTSVPNNKKVGVLWPNDSDGNAIRASLGPLLEKGGFKIVDPGAYQDGNNDFSAQISKFKSEKCDIVNSFGLPPDFATFWRQAAQQGYRPKIAQIAKTGLFPSQVQALGKLGHNLATGTFWSPTYPYRSAVLGKTSQQLADDYEAKTGKQWTQMVGATASLYTAALAALKASGNPKNRKAVAAAFAKLKVETPVGVLDWTKGPVPNVATDPIIGCQWVPASGGKFPLDLVICEHADDPSVPIAAKLKPFA